MAEAQAGAPRALVIDDDESVAVTIGHVLRRAGYDPVLTNTFGDFKAAYDDGFQLVVIDLVMPEVDGVEVIRYLAEQGSFAQLVLASGVGKRVLTSAVQLARERGLDVLGSLAKPFGIQEVMELLGRARPREADNSTAPEVATETELRRALDGDEIRVLFQPQVALPGGELAGVETVVRWQHPKRGLIGPQSFVELAEGTELIDALTMRVAEAAFAQSATWHQAGLDPTVSVNISARCLARIDLPDRLAVAAGASGVSPGTVVLELTESTVSRDPVTAVDVLTRARLKGFELSIDDFGTGFSNLQQLKRFPFTELKLDQSFVGGAQHDGEARTIVASCVDLAHALGLRVVAEGVEDVEDWNLVTSLGCEQAQGHLISPPIGGDELAAWNAGWTAPSTG